MEVELTKMSPRGQVVIPVSVRKEVGAKPTDKFLVFGEDDIIIFRKIRPPEFKKSFAQLTAPLKKAAKEEGIAKKDVKAWISKARAAKKR